MKSVRYGGYSVFYLMHPPKLCLLSIDAQPDAVWRLLICSQFVFKTA